MYLLNKIESNFTNIQTDDSMRFDEGGKRIAIRKHLLT